MIKTVGFCDNVEQCEMAKNKVSIELQGSNPACPQCGKDLEGDRSIPWKPIIILAIALLIMLPIAFFAFKWLFPNSPVNIENPTTMALQPSPTPNIPVICKGELNKNVLKQIEERRSIIMGVEFDAYPLNTSPIYKIASEDEFAFYTPKKDSNEDTKRRKGELERPRDGFDYKIAKMIADYIGLNSEKSVQTREVGSFGELFCLLNRKESDGKFSVDMIMSGIVEDPKYDATIDWSIPYISFSYALITRQSRKLTKLSDFQNKTIGIIQNDSSVEAYVKKELPEATIVKYSDEDWGWTDCAINGVNCEAIDANKDLPRVDACIYDYPFAAEEMNHVSKKAGQQLWLVDVNLPNSLREYRIGVAKGNEDLLEKLNKAISFITKEDPQAKLKYQELVKKYMTPPTGFINIPKQEEGDKVYEVKKGDTLSGIAYELFNDSSKWQELQRKNNIPNENLIRKGQKIFYSEK